jgi:Icc-related predicted phosphoesterase
MDIVCISDTHTKHNELTIPECDMIIHAGDASHNSIQLTKFLDWYSALPIKYKIFVAGNHDEEVERVGYEYFYQLCADKGIIYLEDTSITIEGVKIHGSPWSVTFGDYAFMADDLDLSELAWDGIPCDTNILITHGPAYGILDKVNNNWIENRDQHVGSKTLKEAINNLRLAKQLKYHIIGHIHEAYGYYNHNDYETYNCSIYQYNRELNKPIILTI